jgi:D-beta-D-heptose 7-phosphate kinase/D-beta-D-heptose 1-phosphate adenosyltransferase
MSKIIELDSLRNILDERGDKKVVFTNGCFDILHVGHVRFLKECKKEGDILIVGLNSDRSVSNIKGICRPIVSAEDRAEILEAIEFIDYIIIFDENTPQTLIYAIKPDVLVKGVDWEESNIVGGEFVKSLGGHVARVSHTKQTSSTNIIYSILRKFGKEGSCNLPEVQNT